MPRAGHRLGRKGGALGAPEPLRYALGQGIRRA